MKIFTSKELNKKIIIAILLVMSFNFISPTISNADIGGTLFNPISQLLQGIADLVIRAMQKMFMGNGEIEISKASERLDEEQYKNYCIRYGPGVIFSNLVPALDVNFINPKWTESSPYQVTSKSGYEEDEIKTKKLKAQKIKRIRQVNRTNNH